MFYIFIVWTTFKNMDVFVALITISWEVDMQIFQCRTKENIMEKKSDWHLIFGLLLKEQDEKSRATCLNKKKHMNLFNLDGNCRMSSRCWLILQLWGMKCFFSCAYTKKKKVTSYPAVCRKLKCIHKEKVVHSCSWRLFFLT